MLKKTPGLRIALQLLLVGAGVSLAAANAEAICGDGNVESGEACDDGNLINGDGCSDGCDIENPAGCADGVREGFSNVTDFPFIASCAGNWDIPGVRGQSDKECTSHGNDGIAQTSCIASDLCAVGWHICGSSADVLASAPAITTRALCNTAAVDNSAQAYFTSQTSGPGNGNCSSDPADHNDLFGCGDEGLDPQIATCGVLGRFSNDQCAALSNEWSCPANVNEQVVITKTGSVGGVMCCFGAGAQVSLTAATLDSCDARPDISGTALDSNGTPLNAALVSVSFPSGLTVEVTTDTNGDFTVPWPGAEPDIEDGTISTVGAHVHDVVTNWNGATFQLTLTDSDGDGICDTADVCFGVNNTGDIDVDAICDDTDNCTIIPNTNQADVDFDGLGDACDPVNDLDVDEDGIPNGSDNCPFTANSNQADTDGDGFGDACDTTDGLDIDDDGVPNASDNCPFTPNNNQTDADNDGLGDVCDLTNGLDIDGDGVPNVTDNCPFTPNADQADADSDDLGDVCDNTDGLDADGDGVPNNTDNCPFDANSDQADIDGDGKGDDCDSINDLETPTFIDDCACSSGSRGSSSSWIFIMFACVFGLRRRRV